MSTVARLGVLAARQHIKTAGESAPKLEQRSQALPLSGPASQAKPQAKLQATPVDSWAEHVESQRMRKRLDGLISPPTKIPSLHDYSQYQVNPPPINPPPKTWKGKLKFPFDTSSQFSGPPNLPPTPWPKGLPQWDWSQHSGPEHQRTFQDYPSSEDSPEVVATTKAFNESTQSLSRNPNSAPALKPGPSASSFYSMRKAEPPMSVGMLRALARMPTPWPKNRPTTDWSSLWGRPLDWSSMLDY